MEPVKLTNGIGMVKNVKAAAIIVLVMQVAHVWDAYQQVMLKYKMELIIYA